MRLLPNAISTNALVPANQALRIPDWMNANPGFILDAGKPGTEAVICVATADDPATRLPPEMQLPALASMKGVQGVQGVQQRFASALGKDDFISQVVQWNVVAKKPVPPASAPAAK